MKTKAYILVALLALMVLGCSSDSATSTAQSSDATYLSLERVSSDTQVKAGYELNIELEIDVDGVLSDLPLTISGVKSDDENNSIYFDTRTISSVAKGIYRYELNVTVPRDLVVGDYTLLVTLDPDDLYGEWNDTKQFHESTLFVDVVEHGPDDVIVAEVAQEPETDDVVAAPARVTTLTSGVSTITVEATDSNMSIDATLIVHPNLRDLNETDINVTACLDIGSECIVLPLWSSDGNGTLSDTLELHAVTQGFDTMISVDSILAMSEIQKIIDKILEKLQQFPPQEPILNSALKVTLSYNGLEKTYAFDRQVLLSAELLAEVIAAASTAPQRAPSRVSGSCAPKLIDYSKVYSRSKYGTRFGAGVYAKGAAGLDSDGIHAMSYASLRIKAMGKKDRFMKLNFSADALPGSFSGTGYDLDVEVLGISIFTKSNSLADVSGLSTPVITDVEERAIKLKIDNNETNLSQATLIKQKIYKKAKKSISNYSGSGSTMVGYARTWEYGKQKGYTQQFIVGIVPVTVTAGAQATVGFEADVALSGITAVEGSFKPVGRIGAYVEGGVGVVGYSAGVQADLWLMTETQKNSIEASLDLVEDADGEYIVALEGNIHEKIYNYFRGPNGKLYLYAKYSVPKYCRRYGVRYPCGYQTITRRKYLGKFETATSSYRILDKEQTLFTIDLDDCN